MASDNPYESGASSSASSRTPAEARFTDTMEIYLLKSRPWQMFLGVIGFIGAGLIALVGIAVTLLGLVGGAMEGRPETMMFGVLGLFYLGMAAFAAYPSWCLVQMSTSAGRLMSAYDGEDREMAAEATMRHTQNYFRFNGIVTAVGLGLYVLMLLGTCALGGLGSALTRF